MDCQPLTKWVSVRSTPLQAFQLFTSGIARWWPMETHSVFEIATSRCVVESIAGGRIYEISEEGAEALWGEVLITEPGRRLCFSWHPGRSAVTAQHITVLFHPSEGGTRLELRHDGWASLGSHAEAVRRQYDTGWDQVLARFADRANH